jgi:hypothetical protein
MFKNILCLGDSFFDGAELHDKNLCAPSLVSKHFNCDFHNFANSGVGILSLIEQFHKSKSLITEDTLLLYVLPPSGRIDFFQHEEKNKFVIDYWYFSNVIKGTFDGPVHKNLESNESFVKYKKLYDAIGKDTDFISMGEYIHLSGLHYFFSLIKDVKNIGMVGHPQWMSIDSLNNEVVNLIAKNNLLFNNIGFTGWAKQNKFKIMEYGHPGVEAHYELYNLFLENIS